MAEDRTSEEHEALRLEPPRGRTARPRRRALWGALAVVAVAAGALAVGLASRDGEPPPALPVALGSSTFEATGASDSMLAWVRYEAGDGLPALGGEGEAHRVRPAVTIESVRELAAALGLDAEIAQDGPIWRVGDGGRALEVDTSTGSWWFTASATEPAGSASSGRSGGGGDPDTPVSDDCAGAPADCTITTYPGEGSCTAIGCPEPAPIEQCIAIYPEPPECVDAVPLPEPVAPAPPVDLPTEAEARAAALRVAEASGLGTGGARVDLEVGHDAWYVNVEGSVDEVAASGWSVSVVVGPASEVTSAGGLLATAEALGTYPLIDTRTAIERLNGPVAQAGQAPAGSGPSDDQTVPTLATVPCETLPNGGEACIDPAVPTTFVEEPMPVPEPMPMPEPEATEVVITGAERILVLHSANDGSTDAYLVPGYRMTSDDGHSLDVAAVDEASLAPAPAPPEITVPPEPPATEPGQPEPDQVDPVPPTDCQVLVEDDGSGTTHTMPTCPGGAPPSAPETTHPPDEGE